MSFDAIALATFAATMLVAVMRASTPIVFAALGGLISDLAGSINVALEGIMLVAAFFGVIVSVYCQTWLPGLSPWIYPWTGAFAGILAALLLTGVLAVFHLELKADLIVAGIAINILAAGLTVFLLVSIVGDKGSTASLNSPGLPLIHIPGLAGVPPLDVLLNGDGGQGHHVLLYLALASVVLVRLFLGRTQYGTWLRAVGENRDAALIAGIPVKRVQYLGFFLSGFLASLGGIYLSMGYLSLFQSDMVAGRGFLALAAIFLGRRSAPGTFIAACVFGASSVLATQLGMFKIPTQLVYMIPPVITVIVLVFAGMRQRKLSVS
ncbi:ABC transporter permease [Undibacterium sp. CY18W]|uniref:ABC transporter permease n=1 Tax=Undibacterium hunanense TaxID=2762292 RepID=A0ABR6ZTT4_9BURK|nr:ABC transporter permease [Undibacterium hunanense]MBC3919301.1 ABC transporter permease [Undibacterium hunanense]